MLGAQVSEQCWFLAYNTKCDTKHALKVSPKTVTFKLDTKSMTVEESLLSFSNIFLRFIKEVEDL